MAVHNISQVVAIFSTFLQNELICNIFLPKETAHNFLKLLRYFLSALQTTGLKDALSFRTSLWAAKLCVAGSMIPFPGLELRFCHWWLPWSVTPWCSVDMHCVHRYPLNPPSTIWGPEYKGGLFTQKSVEFGQTTERCILEQSNVHLLSFESIGRAKKLGEDQRTEFAHLLTYSMEQSPSWEANWFCS